MNWEDLEALYWRFDAMHKGYGEFAGSSTSERDAFKRTVKQALAEKDRAYQQLMEKAVLFAKATISDMVTEGTIKKAQAFLKEHKP